MNLTYNDYIDKICYYKSTNNGPSGIPSKYIMILSITIDDHNIEHPLKIKYIELETLKEGPTWRVSIDFLNTQFKIIC